MRFFKEVFVFAILIATNGLICYSQDTLFIKNSVEIHDLGSFLSINNDTSSQINAIKDKPFIPLAKTSLNTKQPAQWLKFVIYNADSIPHEIKISAAFIDYIYLYAFNDSAYTYIKDGDLIPLYNRKFPVGQLCFMPVVVPSHQSRACYLRMESNSAISQQFRSFAINSLKAYPEASFNYRFEQSRIYQAFFYGALIIMLLYNLTIFILIRSATYIYYVVFLGCLILFFASNNGYLLELFWPNYPKIDLYIRFLSTPFLLLSYLLFSKRYLESRRFPLLNKILTGLMIIFLAIAVLMVAGWWKVGRTFTIVLTILTFFIILYNAIRMVTRGYTPARFFLAANVLLILGAIFFASARISAAQQSRFTQYTVQASLIVQAALLSLGLADRMNFVTKQLAQAKLDNERLAKEQETERKRIIEEKNQELEKLNQELDTFIYKTAHDIRGPLARLQGLCNVGLMDVTDTKAVDYLEKLKANADYLNFILSRLGTIHEINNLTLSKRLVSFKEILDEISSQINFHQSFDVNNLRVNIDKNTQFYSDAKLLKFILYNLIENAVKFQKTEDGHTSIIEVHVVTQQENLTIKVMDNGIGIDKEETSDLFEMFTKAADKYKSPGLGLYLVKLCVEKLKGSIAIETAKETTFIVQLPSQS